MGERIAEYKIFYAACFILAIITGINTGFRGDSHTPPIPFGIEFVTLIVGTCCFFIDSRMHYSTKVHKIGLTANGLVMLYVLILAFAK